MTVTRRRKGKMSIPFYPGAPNFPITKKDSGTGSDLEITTVREEKIEPLITEDSLIFTIAANGKTWPKRLDESSAKSDIELQIYSPVLDGCLVREMAKPKIPNAYYVPLSDQTNWNLLTVEQQKKTNAILAQKERINYLLGTLMVPYPLELGGGYGKREPDYTKVKVGPENFGHLDHVKGNNYSVRVLDCSYGGRENCTLRGWLHRLWYDVQSFSFTARTQGSDLVDSIDVLKLIRERICGDNLRIDYPRTHLYAFVAQNKVFDTSVLTKNEKHRLNLPITKDSLTIMYGELNIFDAFSIDDALLIHEEFRHSDTEKSQPYWTLCIAQNQMVGNLLRLRSNNPSLKQK